MSFSLAGLKTALVGLFDVEEHKVHALLTAVMPVFNEFRQHVSTDIAALLDSTRQQVAAIAAQVSADVQADVAALHADVAELKALHAQTAAAQAAPADTAPAKTS